MCPWLLNINYIAVIEYVYICVGVNNLCLITFKTPYVSLLKKLIEEISRRSNVLRVRTAIMTYFLLLAKSGRWIIPKHEFVFAKINIQKRYR